jgi:hypothetical protein
MSYTGKGSTQATARLQKELKGNISFNEASHSETHYVGYVLLYFGTVHNLTLARKLLNACLEIV